MNNFAKPKLTEKDVTLEKRMLVDEYTLICEHSSETNQI